MRRYSLIWLALAMIMAACAPISGFLAPIHPTLTPEPLFIPTVTITNTPAPAESSLPKPCFFNWATKDRPDLNEKIQVALEASGFTEVTVSASDYGENCIAYDTQEVQYFAAMQTDFTIVAHVNPAEQALHVHAFNALTVLKDNTLEGAPGNATSGRVTLTLISETGSTRIHGQYGVLLDLLTQHPDAEYLFESCLGHHTEPAILSITCQRQE